MTRTDTERCPCDRGSDAGARYAECCGRYHGAPGASAVPAQEPEDAPTLMRSRFAAFARERWDYLWNTLHPDHDDRALEFEAWRALAQKGAKSTRYLRLRILDAEPPDDDGVARVLFLATMSKRRRDSSFAELSVFARDARGWRYLAGEMLPRAALGSLEELDRARFERLLHA